MQRRYKDPYHDPRWPKLRLLVLNRDQRICRVRGPRCTGTATQADHIIPWSLDGAWFDLANLRAACEPCNKGRFRTIGISTIGVEPVPRPSRVW